MRADCLPFPSSRQACLPHPSSPTRLTRRKRSAYFSLIVSISYPTLTARSFARPGPFFPLCFLFFLHAFLFSFICKIRATTLLFPRHHRVLFSPFSQSHQCNSGSPVAWTYHLGLVEQVDRECLPRFYALKPRRTTSCSQFD